MTRAIQPPTPTAWLSTLLLSIGLVQASLAEDTSTDEPYSSQQLAVLAGNCASCHGTDGRLAGAVPAIAGRPASALESRLLSFKRDEIADTTIMDRIAKGYSDEELAALATHFASIDKQ
ncbi:c-type cytochrome [Halomonas sp. TRM85114]|uniref:c-type cytochrome n=1 Tax=Halomonas jincaotanensis TaxID=2810616 RepID=UPI001BD5588A|nr:c-type cytochrome [Halomonas jincaotanensis]MBS9405680.1 c-type cytochrome [Halomonas jincaotanensis]